MAKGQYKQYKKAKKERNLAQRGQVAGGTLATLGVAGLAGREYIKKLEEKAQGQVAVNPKAAELLKKGEPVMKKAKKVGIGLAIGGTALAGLSTVKAQRAKRKLKELTKDDSKEKN